MGKSSFYFGKAGGKYFSIIPLEYIFTSKMRGLIPPLSLLHHFTPISYPCLDNNYILLILDSIVSYFFHKNFTPYTTSMTLLLPTKC